MKRLEYARAGSGEYWIVDPELRSITVLSLDSQTYQTAGTYVAGQSALSVLLPGFSVSVEAAFDAGEVESD